MYRCIDTSIRDYGEVKNWRNLHYKGNYYKVIGLARHSENLEEMVVYECLYENSMGKIWVRPKKMFLEDVVVDGQVVPRFKSID